MPSLPRLQRACGNQRKRPPCTERDRTSSEFKLREQCSQTAQHRSNRLRLAVPIGANHHQSPQVRQSVRPTRSLPHAQANPASYEENDHVQDCFSPRFRDGRHLRRSGVCCSHDLRTQHNAVRQLRHLDRSILRLTRDESGLNADTGAVPRSRKSEGY